MLTCYRLQIETTVSSIPFDVQMRDKANECPRATTPIRATRWPLCSDITILKVEADATDKHVNSVKLFRWILWRERCPASISYLSDGSYRIQAASARCKKPRPKCRDKIRLEARSRWVRPPTSKSTMAKWREDCSLLRDQL